MEHLITPDVRSHDLAIMPTAVADPPSIPDGYNAGTVVPDAFANAATPYYIGNPTGTLSVDNELILNGGVLTVVGGVLELDGVPVGGGGGGAVDSVSGTAGQITATPTTGNVVLSLPNVGAAGTVANVASIQTDAQGRVSATTSYGYVPQSAAQVSAAVAAGVAPYAPLAGATFTGPVNTAGTTLTVAAPFANSDAATKLYVDNAVAGITPGGAVNTVVGGSNISVDSASAANPIVNLDVTTALNMQTNEINNCGNITAPIGAQMDIRAGELNLVQSATGLGAPVTFPTPTVMNLTAAGAIGMSAGGAVYMAAAGVVNMSAVGSASVFASGVGPLAGEIYLGGPINHVTIENDGVSITGVGNLSASSNVGANNVIATTSVTAPIYEIGTASNFNSLTQNSALGYLKTNNSVAPVLNEAGLVDSHYNPAVLSLSNTTLKVSAKGGSGTVTEMSSVDIGGIVPATINQFFQINAAPGATIAVSAAQANSATFIDVTAAGNVNVTLPNGVPDGTQFFIGLPYDTAINSQLTVFPVGGGGGGGREVVIKAANGGCLFMANGTVAGNVMYMPTDTGSYLALTGGTLSGQLTVEETTNIEAKNITTALLTPLPSVGYISALGPTQIEGGNFLVANGTATEIGLAASASPPVGQVATIQYNYAADDLLHFNKSLEAPGAVLNGNDVVPLLTFKDAQTFYVSKQGADTNTGSANAPFLTIQAAVTAALATANNALVQIGPGTFTEDITIASVAGITLQGVTQSDRNVEGTIIKGTITVNCTGADNLNNNMVVISGCSITPGRIVDSSSAQHTLIVTDCRFEAEADSAGVAVNVNMTATDGRTFINNCIISQEAGTTGTSSMISVNVGWLTIQNTSVTVRAEGCAVTMSGSSLLARMSNCTLESGSASASPNALLFLNSTTATPHNIALTSFTYSSATSKTTPAILATRPSAGSITALVANCLFAIAGTLAAGNVIQYGAGTALVLLVAGNRSLNTVAAPYASRIQSGATVLPLTEVGETKVTTLNSLSNAVTLAAGSNVTLGTVGNTITINASAAASGVASVSGSGAGISVTGTSNVTVSNTGVTSLVAGTGIALSGSTGAVTVTATGSAGGAVLYFNRSVASDIGGYYSLSPSLLSSPETTLTASSSGGTPALIGAFATASNYPNTTQLDAGIWSFNCYFSVASSGGYAYAEIYKRATGGTETLLGTSDNTVDITSLTPVPASFTFNEAFAAQTVLATDRVVVKLYYVHAGGSPNTVTAYFEGTTHYSYVQTSINSITVSGVQSVTAGTGLSNSGTASDPILNNDGVLSLGVGPGLVNTGTAADPVIEFSGTGTITTQQVDAQKLVVSGTGSNYTTFGALPRVSGTIPTPTDPAEFVPLQYVNSINTGVQSVTAADGSLTVGGTPADPTIAVAASGVVGGAYTYTSLTVSADGRITTAANGAQPVLGVTAADGSITVGGTSSNPTVAVASSGVTPGAYTYTSLTVSADGRITSASSGTAPAINSVTAGAGLSNSGTSTDIVLVNTGLVTATASNGISIAGSIGTNLDIVNTGLRSLAASDSSITVAGTSNDPTIALPAQTLTPTAYTWPALTVNNKGVITAISENSVPFTTINGSLNRIDVSGSPGTATIDLSLLFAGPSNYTFPSAVSVDGYGRITSITNGTNPSGTYLPLAGGTMVGNINMGAQTLSNATLISATTMTPTALSLPNAGAGTGTAFITALQTDTSASPTNNLFITQSNNALTVFKPLANPVIQYQAGAAAGLYTYLVPQFYGERHVFSGTNVAPTLYYNTSNNYTVGGNSISMNPFYVELTNASANTITVKLRFPGALAVFPPASTAPTTTPIAGTWTDQSVTIIGGTTTTSPTLASGVTRRLFFNGTSWFLQ